MLDTVELIGKDRIRVAASGADALMLVNKIADAKRRVSVALIAMGDPYHSTNFSASGARKKLEAAIKSCGLAPSR